MRDGPPYLQLPGERVWPNPEALSELEWQMRYGEPDRTTLLHAASVINAYYALYNMPLKKSKALLAELKREVLALKLPTGSDK